MYIWNLSVTLTILIIWVLLIRFLGKKHLGKRVIVLLWNLILLRAITPFAIPVTIPFLKISALVYKVQNFFGIKARASVTGALTTSHISGIQRISESRDVMMTLVSFVWFMGVIVTFLLIVKEGRKEYIFCRASVPAQCPEIQDIIDKERLRRKVRIYTNKKLSSPITCGVFRPVIIFPEGFQKENKVHVRNMLLHELVHIRRFDSLKRIGLSAVVCAHWFNPLIWVFYRIYRRDQEMACDEQVLKTMDSSGARAYAFTLIYMSVKNGREALIFNGFQKRNTEKIRIVAVIENRKMGIAGILAAIILAGSSMLSFATIRPLDKNQMLFAHQGLNEAVIEQASAEIIQKPAPDTERELEVRQRESEHYKEIWDDIVDNYTNPSEPLTEEQNEACQYYRDWYLSVYSRKRLDMGGELTEKEVRIIKKSYPEWEIPGETRGTVK